MPLDFKPGDFMIDKPTAGAGRLPDREEGKIADHMADLVEERRKGRRADRSDLVT